MMLSLQSVGAMPSNLIGFIKYAVISHQISGTAFNVSAAAAEGPTAFPFFLILKDFNMLSAGMNCAGPATRATCEAL